MIRLQKHPLHRLRALVMIPALLQEPLQAVVHPSLSATSSPPSVRNVMHQQALTAAPLWQRFVGPSGRALRQLAHTLQTPEGQAVSTTMLLLAEYLWPENSFSKVFMVPAMMMSVQGVPPRPDIHDIESMKRIVKTHQSEEDYEMFERLIKENRALQDHATAWYMVARASQLVEGIVDPLTMFIQRTSDAHIELARAQLDDYEARYQGRYMLLFWRLMEMGEERFPLSLIRDILDEKVEAKRATDPLLGGTHRLSFSAGIERIRAESETHRAPSILALLDLVYIRKTFVADPQPIREELLGHLRYKYPLGNYPTASLDTAWRKFSSHYIIADPSRRLEEEFMKMITVEVIDMHRELYYYAEGLNEHRTAAEVLLNGFQVLRWTYERFGSPRDLASRSSIQNMYHELVSETSHLTGIALDEIETFQSPKDFDDKAALERAIGKVDEALHAIEDWESVLPMMRPIGIDAHELHEAKAKKLILSRFASHYFQSHDQFDDARDLLKSCMAEIGDPKALSAAGLRASIMLLLQYLQLSEVLFDRREMSRVLPILSHLLEEAVTRTLTTPFVLRAEDNRAPLETMATYLEYLNEFALIADRPEITKIATAAIQRLSQGEVQSTVPFTEAAAKPQSYTNVINHIRELYTSLSVQAPYSANAVQDSVNAIAYLELHFPTLCKSYTGLAFTVRMVEETYDAHFLRSRALLERVADELDIHLRSDLHKDRPRYLRLRGIVAILLGNEASLAYAKTVLNETLSTSQKGFSGDLHWWYAWLPQESNVSIQSHLIQYLEDSAHIENDHAHVPLPLFVWKRMPDAQVERVVTSLVDIAFDSGTSPEMVSAIVRSLNVPDVMVMRDALGAALQAFASSPEERQRSAEMIGLMLQEYRAREGFDPRIIPVILKAIQREWKKPKIAIEKQSLLLDLLLRPTADIPFVYAWARMMRADDRMADARSRSLREALEVFLDGSEALLSVGQARTHLNSMGDAVLEWRFSDALQAVQALLEASPIYAIVLDGVPQTIAVLQTAWTQYQSGQSDAARSTLAGSNDSLTSRLGSRIKAVDKIERLISEGRYALAREEAQKLLQDTLPKDDRLNAMVMKIDEMNRETAEVRGLLNEGRYDAARNALDALLSAYPLHREGYQLKWQLAQLYMDQGTRMMDPSRPLGPIDSFHLAGELARELLMDPASRFLKESPNSPSAKNGKSKVVSSNPSATTSVREMTKANAERLYALSRGRIALQQLALHHAMIQDVVNADLAKVSRLGGREGTLRLKYWNLKATGTGFRLERLSTRIPFQDVFLEGESFQIYDEVSVMATPAFYQVTQVEPRAVSFERIEGEVVEARVMNEPEKPLPESGFIERVPHWDRLQQRDLLKRLKDRLQTSIASIERSNSRDLPSTGYPLIDQSLTIPVASGEAPIPLVQGPGGTGKTTGVLVAAVRRFLTLYDRLYTKGLRTFHTPDLPLDDTQFSAVEDILKTLKGRDTSRPLKILIASQSHGAIDRVALKLRDEGIPFIRVGSRDTKMHPDIAKEYWATREHRIQAAQEAFENGQCLIVLGTLNGFKLDPFVRKNGFMKRFDLGISEESGKATLAETLTLLEVCDHVALVGDHKQLPPYGFSAEEVEQAFKELGDTPSRRALFSRFHSEHFETSPFERLFERVNGQFARTSLAVNRRSHPWLVQNVVRLFYDFIKPPEDRKDDRPFSDTLVLRDIPFTARRNDEQTVGGSWRNLSEVTAVIQELDQVLNEREGESYRWGVRQVNVITFYQAQVDAILAALRIRAAIWVLSQHETLSASERDGLDRDMTLLLGAPQTPLIQDLLRQWESKPSLRILAMLRSLSPVNIGMMEHQRVLTLEDLKAHPLLVATVDSFQGHENDVILVSHVRSNDHMDIGFLNKFNRLNVAMTRMRHRLILIGDFSRTLTRTVYRKRMNVSDSEMFWEERRWRETETARTIFKALFLLPAKLAGAALPAQARYPELKRAA